MDGEPLVWTVESEDGGGIVVYEVFERHALSAFPDELSAIEHGITCIQDRREALNKSMQALRARRRALLRE